MIKINGVIIPTPSDYTVGIMDLSKGERNAKGTIIIERIATKRKLELSWDFMKKETLKEILTLISTVFFEVEYIDPQTNSIKSGTFYVGNRKAGALDYIRGNIRYKDVSFNLIER